MPFVFGRSLEPREQRTIAIGATVVAVAAVVMLVLVPFGRRWSEREALIAVTRNHLARVGSITGHEGELAEAVRRVEARLDAAGTRLVRARSLPLAAAAVQSMVREYASSSDVTVTRLDAAGAPVASNSSVAIPATIAAQGDIYGIADFLRRLQHGPWLLDITDFSIAPNPVLRGNILQVSIGMRAPIVMEP